MSDLLAAFELAVLRSKGECRLHTLDFWAVVRTLDAKLEIRTVDGVFVESFTAHVPTGNVVVTIDTTGKAMRLVP